MDFYDAYKSLGLSDDEINNLIMKIYSSDEVLCNLSDEHLYLINQDECNARALKYLSNFDVCVDAGDICESVDILYAKTMFLAQQGVCMNEDFKDFLLMDEDGFYRSFGITYEELLNLFPYCEYEENIKLK